jgi:mannose-1-phosphate guanylyltransferase/mannose-6-phosphate isomerase
MEKFPGSTIPLHMVPLDAGWSDLGVWDAVWQVNRGNKQGAQGNITTGTLY